MVGDHRRGFELKMACERADTYVLAPFVNEGQVADPVDIDKDRWTQEAEIEHRNEALAASDDLRVAPAISQRRDCHVDAVGNHIVERCRLHGCRKSHAAMTFIIRLCRLSSSQEAARKVRCKAETKSRS